GTRLAAGLRRTKTPGVVADRVAPAAVAHSARWRGPPALRLSDERSGPRRGGLHQVYTSSMRSSNEKDWSLCCYTASRTKDRSCDEPEQSGRGRSAGDHDVGGCRGARPSALVGCPGLSNSARAIGSARRWRPRNRSCPAWRGGGG